MSLKPQSDKVPILAPVAPVWGELADPGQPVTAVVFECGDTTYTYPYHTLSRWILTRGTTDILRVQTGEDEVTIHGRNLFFISQALGHARLLVLRTAQERYSESTDAVSVTRIEVELNA